MLAVRPVRVYVAVGPALAPIVATWLKPAVALVVDCSILKIVSLVDLSFQLITTDVVELG